MGGIMKVCKFLVPLLLASAVTSAVASTAVSASPVGAMMQTGIAPVAMITVPTNRSANASPGETHVVQSAQSQREEGDFNLALAGALMVGMVVLKRFSR